MREIELKFTVDKQAERNVISRLRKIHGTTHRRKMLHSIYFDTAGHALKNAGMALRLRKNGRGWIQTVKSGRGLHVGLSQVEEVENQILSDRPQIGEIANLPLRTRVAGLVGKDELIAVCETRISRTAYDVDLGEGSRAELAVDRGEIVAGGKQAGIHEIEIELVAGKVGDLFEFARAIFPDGGFQFSRYSKGARGYMLAKEGYAEPPLAPRPAKNVALQPAQDTQSAACQILRECLDQITTNLEVIRKSDDPEGPHQLRIGLRRLRSAFSAFSPAIGCEELDCIEQEAKWLGRISGKLRDLDVLRDDIIRPEIDRANGGIDLNPVLRRTVELAARQKGDVVNALSSERGAGFILDLAKFIETRGWLATPAAEKAQMLVAPVSDLGALALDRIWHNVGRKAKGIAKLDVEGRHALRKELKHLRYASEFFSTLHDPRKVKPFLASLKKLQNAFGYLNDVATLQGLADLVENTRKERPAVIRAVGYLVGVNQQRALGNWADAKALWRDLAKTQQFWK